MLLQGNIAQNTGEKHEEAGLTTLYRGKKANPNLKMCPIKNLLQLSGRNNNRDFIPNFWGIYRNQWITNCHIHFIRNKQEKLYLSQQILQEL